LARVDEFDGLRGMLALWVAVSHMFCWLGLAAFPFSLPHSFPQKLATGIPVILLAAWLLHIVVEKPLMRLGKRLA